MRVDLEVNAGNLIFLNPPSNRTKTQRCFDDDDDNDKAAVLYICILYFSTVSGLAAHC
jgi:hypothetical protein